MECKEVLEQARRNLGPYCKGYTVCNEVVCQNTIPGLGAEKVGDTAIHNFQRWQEIRVDIDTIRENQPIGTSVELPGRRFAVPFFVGPVGVTETHYSEAYTKEEYNDILMSACAAAGIAAFTGDGLNTQIMAEVTRAMAKQGGADVSTVKPWNTETIKERVVLVWESGAFAMATGIDMTGLPFLKNMTPPVGGKSVEEIKEIVKLAGALLILKRIVMVKGALKTKEAGVKAIVVSNRGGRVLDQCLSVAEALPAVVETVDQETMVLMDDGIRSGVDVFKVLAMGASGVLIVRLLVTVACGGGAEDVAAYIKRLSDELADTTAMRGTHTIGEIARDMI